MVSLMTSGPIPPHPYYDKSDSKSYVDLPAPRVKREAEENYQRGHGTVGMVLQIEGQRMPSGYRRNSAKNKDHIAENVRRMRRIQRDTRNKEETKQEPVKAMWKSGKYEGVESRVRGDLMKEPPAPRPGSANYLRAHSRTGFIPQSARPASTEPPEEKLTIAKAQSAREVRVIRRDLDFIKMNGKAVKQQTMRRSPSASRLDEVKRQQEDSLNRHKKGAVPDYLNRRREEWAQAEQDRLAAIPDPDMPPGHRLLPNAERRQTLDRLKQTEMELHKQLASLPIRSDTLRLRTKKEELERKIAEVEEAVKIFSRPKVFVKMDS